MSMISPDLNTFCDIQAIELPEKGKVRIRRGARVLKFGYGTTEDVVTADSTKALAKYNHHTLTYRVLVVIVVVVRIKATDIVAAIQTMSTVILGRFSCLG